MYFGHGGLEPEVSQFRGWIGRIRCDQHGRRYKDGRQSKPSNMNMAKGRGLSWVGGRAFNARFKTLVSGPEV